MDNSISLILTNFFLPFVLVVAAFVLADSFAARPYRWLCEGRQFLNALQMAHERGVPYEQALIEIAEHGQGDMGLQFHLLATWLREGLPLHEALEKVPRFIPRPIEKLVVYGSRNGTLDQVLPVGQRTMQELADQSANTEENGMYSVAVAIVLFGISSIYATFVLPKFQQIFADLTGSYTPSPVVLTFFEHYDTILVAHQGMIALMLISYLFVFNGPASSSYLSVRLPAASDWIQRHVAWQWARCRHRFGMMLAQLLDHGVPEERALLIAGDYAANRHFQQRVIRALTDLRQGVALPEALRHTDLDGDFVFRMKAAAASGRPFGEALDDWFEASHAKLSFRERAASDLANTVFTCYNAVVVGAFAASVFGVEISIMNAAAPW